ncbi:MAG TPA: DUF6541 family protein [Jatrophihabitans sp.]|uniref:DUF6541 family protein n=1 Tax=Jatrophihabitans sp. TaxID=1932789 RepID=UPI002EDEAA13
MLTTLVATVLAFLPGAVLGLLVPPGRFRWAAWAAAPILTLGLTSVAMAWLPVFGLPNSVGWILAAELVLAGAAVVAARLLLRRRTRTASGSAASGSAANPTDDVPAAKPERVTARHGRSTWLRVPRWGIGGWVLDLVCVTGAMAVCVAVGQLMVGRFRFPPGWDGMNHALLSRNIGVSSDWTMTSVCSTGSTLTQASCKFYPLAGNVLWAQAATLSDGYISTAMNAWAALITPLALVLGIYAAVRALGGPAVVAGCAAVASALIGPVWEAMLTGRVTEEIGPVLGVMAAVLFALAARGGHPLRLGFLAGLSTAGLLLTHTYEVLFAGTLAIALAVFLGGGWRARSVLKATAATGITAVLAIAPYLGPILHAKGERATGLSATQGDLAATFKFWVTDFNRYILYGYPGPGGSTIQQHVRPVEVALWLTLACLIASPLCFFFKPLRWARPWIVMFVMWTAIGIWTSYSDSKAALFVGGLWYGTRDRLRAMIFPVYGIVTVAGACAIGLGVAVLVAWLRRRSAGRVSWAPWLPAVTALALVVVLVAAALAPASRRPLRKALAARTPAGPSYVRTFDWLAANIDEGKVVAYDRHLEFMTWSYADYGVPLLFGIPPLPAQKAEIRDYAQRFQAWDWLVNNPSASPSGCLVRKYGIQYVVTGKVRVPGMRPHYQRARLARSTTVKLVHSDGGVNVYEVNDQGMACPGGT